MIIIRIEELIGNAFISYFEATGKRILSFKKILKYGEKIVNDIKSSGKHAVLYLHKDETDEFFCKYSKWFKCYDNENEVLVVMSDDITSDMLYNHFTGYLSFEVYKIFRNIENLKILL